jgi:hypothetical protein
LPSFLKKLRFGEVLRGVLGGSATALLLPTLKNWLDHVWTITLGSITTNAPGARAPLTVSMLAILFLILPKFYRRSLCLFRSWQAGLVRGITPVWALAVFGCWMKNAPRNSWIYFILAAVAFHILTEVISGSGKSQQCSRDEISKWIPSDRRPRTSSVGFDKPIESWNEDAVGRQGFVETVLTRVLVDREPAIGITAEFGEGKSSVLQLILCSIENGAKAIAVPFRTWLPGSEQTLLDSLFTTATTEIRAKYFLPTWRSTFKKYGRVVLGVIPKEWAFISDLLPTDSQPGQIEELTKLFSRLPVRVIFLLDEIDRMHEEELSVLLKVLRGSPELTNVSYVCAFSREALARVISPRDTTFGIQYLDKFFPVQLQLPRIDGDLREYLFSDRLASVLERERAFASDEAKKHFENARNSLWFGVLQERLTNFRILGQLLRGFENSLHQLNSEVNPFDLLVLESIRLLLPSTYEFVYQSGRHLHDQPGGIERWNRTHVELDREDRQKAAWVALDAHFNGLPAPERDLARNLLSRIFPSVREYLRDRTKGQGPLTIQYAEGERRIQDSRFFPRYFIYLVPATRFGEREMDDFIGSIRSADETTVGANLETTLPTAERDDLRRIDFLRRLTDRAQGLPEKQAMYLAVELSKRTAGMLASHVVYQVTKGLVLTLAARFQGTPQLQLVLQDVVLNSASDGFASDIVNSSVSARKTADEITNWNGFLPEQMKKVLGDRMRRRHPTPVHQLLTSSVDDAVAFSRWKLYVPEDAGYMRELFKSAFDFDVRNLGIFLQWLLPGNISYEGSPIKFVEGFYSPATEIAERLRDAADENIKWEPGQAAAIERFWSYLSQENSQPPPTEDTETTEPEPA